MRVFVPFLVVLFYALTACAQSDTTFTYFSKDYSKVTKDSAEIIHKRFFNGETWEHRSIWARTGHLQMLATCKDDKCVERVRGPQYFRENGTLKMVNIYDRRKLIKQEYYYQNGKKSGEVTYSAEGSSYQGWDSSGVEVVGYVAEREAYFPGGAVGWQRYLQQNLNAGVAARSTKQAGLYTVQVGFTINEEGKIKQARLMEATEGCSLCIHEAIRVVAKGPRWNPAMLNNKPIEFQAIQHITFQVLEDEIISPKKQRKREAKW